MCGPEGRDGVLTHQYHDGAASGTTFCIYVTSPIYILSINTELLYVHSGAIAWARIRETFEDNCGTANNFGCVGRRWSPSLDQALVGGGIGRRCLDPPSTRRWLGCWSPIPPSTMCWLRCWSSVTGLVVGAWTPPSISWGVAGRGAGQPSTRCWLGCWSSVPGVVGRR
jgi:hypothetical protein